MSKYTIQLRYILESMADVDLIDADDIEGIINSTYNDFFNFTINADNFELAEMRHLKKHILMHFYDYEIGFETVGLFKLKLNSLLQDIMPKYDAKMKLLHMEVDFFDDYSVTHDAHNTGNNSNVGNNRNVYCDTPQGQIEFDDLTNVDYVTNLSQDYTSNSNNIDMNNHDVTTGNFGNNADKFQKYIDCIQNIELEIINDLRPLFMKIF